MPRRFLLSLLLVAGACITGCGGPDVAGPMSPAIPAGDWNLSGTRFSDGPFVPAGPDTREGRLRIEPDGNFLLIETTPAGTTRRQGFAIADGSHLTLLATDAAHNRVQEVLQFVWASDGGRLTLTAAVDERWQLFAYVREMD